MTIILTNIPTPDTSPNSKNSLIYLLSNQYSVGVKVITFFSLPTVAPAKWAKVSKKLIQFFFGPLKLFNM